MTKPKNRNHRATGRPHGRPRIVSRGLCDRILEALARRLDPQTNLVEPKWADLVRELGVSRSVLARHIAQLRERGAIQTVYITVSPSVVKPYYLLKEVFFEDEMF